MEEKGYVYILTNPAFREDWVKIGKSSRPVNVRSKELDNTAVPLPFEIYATMQTSKYHEVEKLVHKTIDRLTDLRIRQNREFFNVPPQVALDIFRDIASTIDDAVIEVFVEDQKQQLHTPKSHTKKEKAKPTQHLFFCTRAGSNAQGYFVRESGEFVVLAGSELRSGECDSLSAQSVEKRQAFVENHCSQTDGKIILNADFTFPSPSAAAAMVVGGSSNGWTRWKDADSKTLDEVYRKK